MGFIKAGFQPLAAFDLWPLAVENYLNNVGDHAFVWDLANGTLPGSFACDVLLAGSPCQGFSTAGRRLLNDPRNDLLLSAVKIGINLKPKALVFENVLGAVQGAHKKHWDAATEGLRIAGYQTTTLIVDGRQVGVPQSRRRVFLLAWNTGLVFEPVVRSQRCKTLAMVLSGVEGLKNHNPIILDPRSSDGKIAAKIAIGQKLCDVRGADTAVHTWQIPEVFGRTTASEKNVLAAVMRLRRRCRVRNTGDADPISIEVLEEEIKRSARAEVVSLVTKGYLRKIGSNIDLKHTFNGKYRRANPDGASFTVDTHFGNPRLFLHPFENRGFSVREAARIQTFPDTYEFSGRSSDQFKLVGNAVPPAMGGAIAKLIAQLFKE